MVPLAVVAVTVESLQRTLRGKGVSVPTKDLTSLLVDRIS